MSKTPDQSPHDTVTDLRPDLLDERLPTPLYHQVQMLLTDRIRRGDFPAGSILPGEHQIAHLLGASRITVKRAMNELAAAGLVTRHRGRGTVVAPLASLPVVTGAFDTLIDSLRVMGLETQLELLETSTLLADDATARALGLAPGQEVQRIVRLRRLSGAPFSYLVSWLPLSVAGGYAEQDLATRSMLSLLDQAGATPDEAELWITAVAAEPVVAGALNVSLGAPLLRIERIMRKADGTVVQLIHAHYRADRFQYHLKSRRQDADAAGWGGDA